MTLTAVDCQSFAGGFTLGVAQAGFRVVKKLEMTGGFGVPSVDVNRDLINPNLEIEVGDPGTWLPVDGLPFLFGNPPCSGFSGSSDKHFKKDGQANKINDCMHAVVEYGARCTGSDGAPGPEVIAFESVQNAFKQGRELMTTLLEKLRDRTGQPYTLYHVKHNALALGGCAVRRRYFWLAARIPIGFTGPELERVPILDDAIGDLMGLANQLEPQPYRREATWWSKDLRRDDGLVDGHQWVDPEYARHSVPILEGGRWAQGDSLTDVIGAYYDEFGTVPDASDQAFVDKYLPKEWAFGGAWQPKRWYAHKAARVITGGSVREAIHPHEDRCLSMREMFRIQGFPDTWLIEPMIEAASFSAASLWPGKGIPVQSGQWLAEQVRAALEGDPRDDGRLTEVGENELEWNGTRDHAHLYNELTGERFAPGEKKRAGTSRRRAVSRPTTTDDTTKDADVSDDTETKIDPIREALEAHGTAEVDLSGIDDPKEQKREKERLYQAAYSMGRKISVRTDKSRNVAVGTLRDEPHQPASKASSDDAGTGTTPEPSAAATASRTAATDGPGLEGRTHVDAHGRAWRFEGGKWLRDESRDVTPQGAPTQPEPTTTAAAEPVAAPEAPTTPDFAALAASAEEPDGDQPDRCEADETPASEPVDLVACPACDGRRVTVADDGSKALCATCDAEGVVPLASVTPATCHACGQTLPA